jgi:hypothetical protein
MISGCVTLWIASPGTACGKRGADVRPDFNWDKMPVSMMEYR